VAEVHGRKSRIVWDSPFEGALYSYRVRLTLPDEGMTKAVSFYETAVGECSVSIDSGLFGLPQFPWLEGYQGEINIGVTSVNDAGNESGFLDGTFSFDFTVPDPPTGLQVEGTE
jgi:hypothetical protein